MKKTAYNLISTFRDGRRRHIDICEGLTRSEAYDVIAEQLDVPKTGGNVAKPTLSKVRSTFSRFGMDDEFIRREYARQAAAYSAWTKAVKIVESESTGSVGVSGNETLLIETVV